MAQVLLKVLFLQKGSIFLFTKKRKVGVKGLAASGAVEEGRPGTKWGLPLLSASCLTTTGCTEMKHTQSPWDPCHPEEGETKVLLVYWPLT
jgi:hypothetical protein